MKWISLFILIVLSLNADAQEPQIKGGLEAFVQKNTVYPAYSLHNCIQGTIKVSFKVNAKGDVYYAGVNDGMGIDLDEEALRLIRMTSGKWEVPTSYDTTSVLIVPVNFILSGFDCNKKTPADIARAIQSYKNEEELIAVISNFYQFRDKGNIKPNDEAKILRIKKELNIDNDYLDSKIEAGLKKYKQGDKQGACKDFTFVKNMGSDKATELISRYCN